MTLSCGKVSHIAMRVSQIMMRHGFLLLEGGSLAQPNPVGTRDGGDEDE